MPLFGELDYFKDQREAKKKADAKEAYAPLPQKQTPSFDALFEKYRDDVPASFLKALASKASGLNPNKNLFGVSAAALEAFNSKMKESHNPNELTDPALNTRVAVYIIKNVVDYFAANYPDKLMRQWANPEYVALVTHAYNVGYKDSGLGKPMASIYKSNPDKLNLDNIAAVAKQSGIKNESTYAPKFLTFAKEVAKLSTANQALSPSSPDSLTVPPPPSKGLGGMAIAALVFVPIAALVFGRKK
jgi:hypothetical protein